MNVKKIPISRDVLDDFLALNYVIKTINNIQTTKKVKYVKDNKNDRKGRFDKD